MALKVLRRRLGQPGGLVGPLDEISLRERAGLSDTRRLAIGIRSGAANHGADCVAVSKSIGQALDNKGPDTLAAAVAVGPIVEGM